MRDADISETFELQARGCQALGSTFSAGILRLARADYDDGGPVRSLFDAWEGVGRRALIDDAVALRFLGACHDLSLSGDDPAVTVHYPTDAEAAWAALSAAIDADPERFKRFMSHEPQTNEVGRSACLLGGFLTVAAETGLPLSLVELGASAGLNQIWDRFGYRLGKARWGDAASPVQLAPQWQGALPQLDAVVKVAARRACDRKPVDISQDDQRRRLIAYVWADQPERLARVKAAVDLAARSGVKVEAAEARDFVRAAGAPGSGTATVIFHSVFWQYMPPEAQTATKAAIEAHAATATSAAPLAWLRMEPDLQDMLSHYVTLTLWPTGETRVLAQVHPHGAQINWLT